METLELDGKVYKKASAVARDLGYTADYVGQLCRGGKVDAQLVGRSWYVNIDSIASHKDTRYRSTAKKSRQAVQDLLQKQSAKKPTPEKIIAEATKKTPTYETDDAALLPEVKTQTQQPARSIAVDLAEAEPLPVRDTSDPFAISIPERPKIAFTGKIAVQSLEDEVEQADQTHSETEIASPAPQNLKPIATDQSAAFKRKPMPVDAVMAMRRHAKPTVSPATPQGSPTQVKISSQARSQPAPSWALVVASFLLLTTAFAFLASSLVGQRVVATSGITTVGYQFSPEVMKMLENTLKNNISRLTEN